MIRRAAGRLLSRLRAERGFMLLELLVSMLIGIALLLFLFDLVDASQTASSTVVSRVDATQRGRVSMEQVTQRLRAQVCIGAATPIVTGDASLPTDADSVTFYSDLDDDSNLDPERRRLFVQGGALREQIWQGTGEPPATTFPAAGSPTRTRILTDRIRRVRNASGTELPYFRYYAYDAASPAQPSLELTPPLSAADTNRIVRVELGFAANAGRRNQERVDTTFTDGVTTRFANPSRPDQASRGPQCGV